MARIRHIAIATRDLDGTKKFYIEGLGLKEVGKINTPTSEGCYLSDGHINFAILKFKYDEPAKTEGTLRYTGIHHFGLEVENMEEAQSANRESGRRASSLSGDRRDGEARQRRGQVLRSRRRDDRPFRARLARHQVTSRSRWAPKREVALSEVGNLSILNESQRKLGNKERREKEFDRG